MKTTYLTLVGNTPIRFDLEESLRIGPVIASGNANKSINFPYATCNSEQNLQDMLNTSSFNQSSILVPESLFKKYVFFDFRPVLTPGGGFRGRIRVREVRIYVLTK